ncbi:MAG: iron-containing alcohol dehydrogenase [Clostridia bacterium]|nr:4-hydroxybutyrate dehydrogenase [Lachnospiraceae bacterium]NCC00823.1 iron-containing alcohol dehydrogenase [Clostridia bacterium]NCD02053.1 iron-containing alcohol dehydrogenase [Clostridia bacterium]
MKEFRVVPVIKQYDTVKEFCSQLNPQKDDLIFVSGGTFKRYFEGLTAEAKVVDYRQYGDGEPSDDMVTRMREDVGAFEYKRVIAVGGGTILDVAKLFSLQEMMPVLDLFDKKIPAVRSKKLILVPTTCGTGSEVTNISVLLLNSRNTKLGLADDALLANEAVLIPELLKGLPKRFFAASSIDALIHAVESFTSPKASPFSRMFSSKAISMILNGFKAIVEGGEEARMARTEDFLLASTYAGIAFSNAGCAAVHAMSFPLGGMYHVPHGEANYALFTQVYKVYQKLQPIGAIQELNQLLTDILGCSEQDVYEKLEELLNQLLMKQSLSAYGVKEDELELFTDIVMEKQGRLMANNYTELSRENVLGIYKALY